MKRFWVFFAMLCCCAVQAQTEGIWFLHLRMTNGQVVLVNQKKTPGVLKRSRGADAARAVQIELQSANGATVWSQTIDDPAVRRIEYEDPQQPGKLRAREVILTNVEFTVRVPFRSDARAAVVSRRHRNPQPEAQKKAVAAPPYVEIGRVELKPEEKQ
ncbi:MAG TPA: hypothetical protein VK530_03175 [Candidatus Acidoferrum sp.]|nr:hypothetical protein [Candidatus Acidoferrum sp.]